MNPIAKRLRDRNTPYGWASLAETAAVEIDRLEAENERLLGLLRGVEANRYWEGRWRDEKAENERLRVERAGDQQRLFHYEAEIRLLEAEIVQLWDDLDLRNQTALDRKEIIAKLEALILRAGLELVSK